MEWIGARSASKGLGQNPLLALRAPILEILGLVAEATSPSYNGVMLTLNERAWKLCDAMVADAEGLGIAVHTLGCGTRLIDCGVKALGGIEAGRRLAEVCMSGLGTVELYPESGGRGWSHGHDGGWFDPSPLYAPLRTKYVRVDSTEPIAACMASQYAGWEVKGEKFFAMGSGPMRAAACREDIFKSICNCEKPEVCVGVLETSKLPPDAVCIDLAEKCGIHPAQLTLLVARTSSPAGTVQIVARSLETALHKLHELGFDLSQVKSGFGVAPLPPVAADDLTAIGWTNDAILYGGYVGMFVGSDESHIEEIGPRVPSNTSPDYGRPFSEIFKRYNGDFYRIDPLLFSPAEIAFINLDRPRELRYGRLAPNILVESFAKK
jgi:methenyltetrahydromethanopterin cyclohydrolase